MVNRTQFLSEINSHLAQRKAEEIEQQNQISAINVSSTQFDLDLLTLKRAIQNDMAAQSSIFTLPPQLTEDKKIGKKSLNIPIKGLGSLVIKGEKHKAMIYLLADASENNPADRLDLEYPHPCTLKNILANLYFEIKGEGQNQTPWNADNSCEFWRFGQYIAQLSELVILSSPRSSHPFNMVYY